MNYPTFGTWAACAIIHVNTLLEPHKCGCINAIIIDSEKERGEEEEGNERVATAAARREGKDDVKCVICYKL